MKNGKNVADSGAIDKIRANQNRIQNVNNYITNEDKAFFNNPNNAGKYEETVEGATGGMQGKGNVALKKFLKAFGFLSKAKWYIIGGLIAFFLLLVVIIGAIFTDETFHGAYMAGAGYSDDLFGSTSNSLNQVQKQAVANTISDFYQTSSIASESFFADLHEIANHYNNYPYVADEFDIAMIASTVHYNKFISDAVIISGAINSRRTMSNIGISRARNFTFIPRDEVKGFYELADIALGTDLGLPDPEFRGLAGNLVGSRVISACVTNPKDYISVYQISGKVSGSDTFYSLLDSVILKYETFYELGTKTGYMTAKNSNDEERILWHARQLKDRLDRLRSTNTFDDYYDTSEFNPNMSCSSGQTLVHYVEKYMNYETFAKYLLNEYVPETYIECVSCSSERKREDTIQITANIFDNKNLFSSLYYGDIVDTIVFVDGSVQSTSETVYQLPSEVSDNFTSPYGLTSVCTITDGFTSNRNGYSHFAIDAVVNDANLYAVYDGVVDVVVTGVPNIFSQWNGGACVDENGNMDRRSNGNYVRIKHVMGSTTYYSYYMHMDAVDVKSGDKVSKGQKIGTQGNTGCSSGNHLHYQLQDNNGKRYDPSLLFAQCEGVSIKYFEPQSLMEYLRSVYPKYSYVNSDECIVKVYEDGSSGPYFTMTLEEYVAGVVKNEMSVTDGYEALKAQAIAARSEYINHTNFCTTSQPVTNSEAFQAYMPIDLENNPTDVINILAARETQGMIITYSHGNYFTEYASFPCEVVWACTVGEPYYRKTQKDVVCRYYDDYGNLIETKDGLKQSANAEPGSKAESRCGAYSNGNMKGSFYYCGSSGIPRQFAEQLGIECDDISVTLTPHAYADAGYRTFSVNAGALRDAGAGYSNYHGHNRGMSQVLADVLADSGWTYTEIINYFYTGDGLIDERLINIETIFRHLDPVSEYEASYSDGCSTSVDLYAEYGTLTVDVPLDFFVAGNLAHNFGNGARVNKLLLQAAAITARTRVLARTNWGAIDLIEFMDEGSQYGFTYTESKVIYDAVNNTGSEVLIDRDGYIFEAPYYHAGEGTTFGTASNLRTTYELEYIDIPASHKVTIPYKEFNTEGLSIGNKGLVYNVASYLANNWYFMNKYEVLDFFFGVDYNVVDLGSLSTHGAVKKPDGTIEGEGAICDNKTSVLNASLEEYVAENGKGTIDGVVAAAYWLYVHSRPDMEIHLPYQLGGEWQKLGVNPAWGSQIGTEEWVGLDCVGFIRWCIINGYLKLPAGYNDDVFVFPTMKKYIEDNKLVCGENGESCYYEFEDEDGNKNVRSVPLLKYAEEGLINKGDILWHPQGVVYRGESEGTKYSHIAIVYEVNLENKTMTLIHSTGGDPGIHYSVLDLTTGKYESGSSHGFTSIIRMSEMDARGYFK